MAIALATLQTWYDAAITARNSLSVGGAPVELNSPDGSIRFTESNLSELDAWIDKLYSWISAGGVPDPTAAVTGPSKRSPVYFTL